jgi:hypothetical protein
MNMKKTVYHIYNLFEKKIAYYLGPKCGCSTLRAWDKIINNENLFSDMERLANDEKIGLDEAYMLCIKTQSRYAPPKHPDPAHAALWETRFCVVRDPVERFVSTYKQLIMGSVGVKSISVDQYMTICEKNHDSLVDVYPKLSESEWRNIIHHFEPQYKFYGTNPKLFTHIYNLNQMKDVYQMLIEKTKINFPYLHLNTTAGKHENLCLTEDQKCWVKKHYILDYEIYQKWM